MTALLEIEHLSVRRPVAGGPHDGQDVLGLCCAALRGETYTKPLRASVPRPGWKPTRTRQEVQA